MTKLKFPAKLGAAIDLAYQLRDERLIFQRNMEEQLKELKEREKEIKDHIINTFSKSDIEGAKGSVASAGILRNTYPRPVDWEKIHKYIRETNQFDLLEKRLLKSAFKERFEAGVSIPGVEAYEEIDLSLTRIKK